MGSSRAAAGTLLFLVVAPGVVAGVIPWMLTGWDSGDAFGSLGLVRVIGAVVLVAGVAALLEAFARFVLEGWWVSCIASSGTPCTSRSA